MPKANKPAIELIAIRTVNTRAFGLFLYQNGRSSSKNAPTAKIELPRDCACFFAGLWARMPPTECLIHAMTSKHSSAKRLLVTGLFDDLQTFADIESRISAIFGNKERGDDFEIFAEADLATQKIAQARPMSGLAACEEAPTYRLHAVTRDGG